MDGHKADKLLNFSLLLFAATCILSITLSEAALVLMLAAILWKAFTSPEGFRQPLAELHANPLVFPLAVYLLVYIFSSIFSVDAARSWSRLDTEVIKALSAVLVFSAVARSGREKAALWFVAGASISALIGLWQFADGIIDPRMPELARAHGTMIAVTYAEVTSLALILAIILLPSSEGRTRTALWAAFLTLASAFSAALSRGPALGLFVALAVVFIFQKESRKLVLAALCILFIFFAGAAASNKVNRAKITSVASFLAKKQSAEKLDYAANVRITMWKAGVSIFKDYPLTGTGPYSLRKVFNLYHKRAIDGHIDYPDVHNLYIQRAADSGVPGLLSLLLLFWALLGRGVASFTESRDIYGLWGAAAFAGFAVMMLTDSSFDLPRVSFCIYLMATLSAAIPGPQRPSSGK